MDATLSASTSNLFAACDGAKFDIDATDKSAGQCLVTLYGSNQSQEPFNWSLKKLSLNVESDERADLVHRLKIISERSLISHWYAPVPTEFNGKICEAHELRKQISLDGRNNRIFRGLCADGVMLPRGSGFLLSTGGCPLIVATDGVTVCTAHAGLKSLIRADDHHVSVVKRISEKFRDPSRVKVRVFFAIRPERYEFSSKEKKHAPYAHEVLKMLYDAEYGACVRHKEKGVALIDLAKLIQLQTERFGMTYIGNHSSIPFLPDKGVQDTRCEKPYDSYRNLAVVTFI